MTSRAVWTVVALAAGCDASLGGSGTGGMVDGGGGNRGIDARPADSSIDARPCAGGNAAAVAPDGSCLVHFTAPATYASAKAGCQSIGGHLAYLKTAQLDTFAEQFIGNVDTWIGGSDTVTEGSFAWDDGTAFAFTAWGPGEPNGGGGTYQEDCVLIAGARAGKLWDDRPCDASEVPTSGNFAYLCQY